MTISAFFSLTNSVLFAESDPLASFLLCCWKVLAKCPRVTGSEQQALTFGSGVPGLAGSAGLAGRGSALRAFHFPDWPLPTQDACCPWREAGVRENSPSRASTFKSFALLTSVGIRLADESHGQVQRQRAEPPLPAPPPAP